MGQRSARIRLKGIKATTRVVCFGVEKSVEDWAFIANLPEGVVLDRLRRGKCPWAALIKDARFVKKGKEYFYPSALNSTRCYEQFVTTIEDKLGLTIFEVNQLPGKEMEGYIIDEGETSFHMTDDEIRRNYARAVDPEAQIEIIAELNAVSWVMARDKLVELGLVSASVEPPAPRKPGRPKKCVSI